MLASSPPTQVIEKFTIKMSEVFRKHPQRRRTNQTSRFVSRCTCVRARRHNKIRIPTVRERAFQSSELEGCSRQSLDAPIGRLKPGDSLTLVVLALARPL